MQRQVRQSLPPLRHLVLAAQRIQRWPWAVQRCMPPSRLARRRGSSRRPAGTLRSSGSRAAAAPLQLRAVSRSQPAPHSGPDEALSLAPLHSWTPRVS